jgi:uncharacterized protein (DUF1501 family)
MPLTRREFLCRSFGAMGAAALAFERFGLLKAFAQSSDYKALVCIFLFGGSDTGNVVIPNDDNASSPFAYASYSKARQSSGLAIPQSSLLQINPPSIAGSSFGLHPSLTGLHDLWDQGKMAVVCNVGPLQEPTNRTAYLAGTAHVPVNLFSHSDQQNEWQTSIADQSKVPPGFGGGWGGRTADKTGGFNATTFPPLTSVAGTPIFCSGNVEQPLAIAPAPTALSAALSLDGFPNPPDNDPRYIAMTQLLQEDQAITLVKGASGVTTQALGVEKTLRTAGNPAVPPFPLNTSLGNQLNQVAKMISVRNSLQMSRQIFFCSLGGFDTHFNQVNNGNSAAGTHANLLLQLSNAMKTFYDATVNLGVASQVTTFILSDFARTFVPNGNLGTDHAWGSHHFVVGGAVRGGDFYGVPGSNGTVFPTVVANGPDDTDTGGGARGRWIPTTAVDQYGATLASWFGVSSVDLPAVFPNIARFGSTNLGFV